MCLHAFLKLRGCVANACLVEIQRTHHRQLCVAHAAPTHNFSHALLPCSFCPPLYKHTPQTHNKHRLLALAGASQQSSLTPSCLVLTCTFWRQHSRPLLRHAGQYWQQWRALCGSLRQVGVCAGVDTKCARSNVTGCVTHAVSPDLSQGGFCTPFRPLTHICRLSHTFPTTAHSSGVDLPQYGTVQIMKELVPRLIGPQVRCSNVV